jgi:hypothetical protein
VLSSQVNDIRTAAPLPASLAISCSQRMQCIYVDREKKSSRPSTPPTNTAAAAGGAAAAAAAATARPVSAGGVSEAGSMTEALVSGLQCRVDMSMSMPVQLCSCGVV